MEPPSVLEAAHDLLVACSENLNAGKKRRIVAPLNAKLRTVLALRFRAQGKAVKAAIKPLIGRLSEADSPVPAAVQSAALAALAVSRPIRRYPAVTRAAYDAGSALTLEDLGLDDFGHLDGPSRTSATVEAEIDKTTGRALAKALAEAFLAAGSVAAALATVGEVFTSAARDRAPLIAEYEISTALHDGQTDAAKSISTDLGIDVEKYWETEDGACDECLACEDEGWVELDFVYPAAGAEDPPLHPNCLCSLLMRRAEED